MLLSEITDLFQILSSLLGVIAIFYAGKQVSLLRRAHCDNHDWNRRKAAQDATLLLHQTLAETERLHSALNIINRKEAIPLDEIKQAVKQDKSLQLIINHVLNSYNSLCRGVEQAIYDEEIVKKSRRGSMLMTYRAFQAYIEHRRNERNLPTMWSSLERLVLKWKSEDNNPDYREPTGNVS